MAREPSRKVGIGSSDKDVATVRAERTARTARTGHAATDPHAERVAADERARGGRRGSLPARSAEQAALRLLCTAISLGTVVVVARSLGTAGFAEYGGLLGVTLFAQAVADPGLNSLLLARHPADGPGLRSDCRASVVASAAVLVPVAVALSAVVMAGLLARHRSWSWSTAAPLLLALAVVVVVSALQPVAQVTGRTSRASGFDAAGRAAGLALVSVGGARHLLTPTWAAWSVALTVLVAGGGLLTPLGARPAGGSLRRGLRLLVDSVPLAAATVVTVAYVRVDVLLLAAVGSTEDLAVYVLAYRFVDAAVGVAGPTVGVVLPRLSARVRAGVLDWGPRTVERRTVAAAAVAGIAAVGATIAVGDAAFRLVGGDRLDPGLCLVVLATGLAFTLPNLVLGNTALFLGRARAFLLLAVALLAVNVGLNLVLIGPAGATGAAGATLATEAAATAALVAIVRRRAAA